MTVHFVAPSVYRFGEFELDTANRELRRNGKAIEFPTKAFSCVLYLVENRNRAVDRDELMLAVWGHVHLTDSVLGQAIRHARQALSDNGEDQRIIKTVRGFGYRWVAQVESSAAPADAPPRAAASAEPPTTTRRRRYRLVLPLAAALVVLIAVVGVLRWHHEPAPTVVTGDAGMAPASSESIALLLPVEGAEGANDTWIRLGVMDFMANRLRAAGQPMVPTDTVIMALHGSNAEPGPNDLLALTGATHARLVLAAQAERRGKAWHVSLHSLGDARHSLAAVGDGDDILTAARNAADQLATMLGRIPASIPNETLALTALVQQINAAMLAQKPDVVQRLVQNAAPELQAMPEIRYQLGRIALLMNDDRAGAQSTFEALLNDVPAEQDPVLRARVLTSLGGVYAMNGDRARAEPVMEAAAALLEHRETPDTLETLGNIWMNLGTLAQERHDLELSRERYSRARRFFEGTGDMGRLATLELNVGVLEARGDNYADALHRFESAAALQAEIRDLAGELKSQCFVVEVQLRLLNPVAAMTVEPRIRELLSQVTQPGLLLHAKVTLSSLLDATGRELAADALANEVLAATESKAGAQDIHRDALMTRAERAARLGDTVVAAKISSDVVQQLASDSDGPEADSRADAWRILVRAHLARGDFDAAARTTESMTAWSRKSRTKVARINASLAQAELTAALGRREAADTAYGQALALADESQIPLRKLQVAESYVGWLLDNGSPAVRQDRILQVAERIAEYADHDYGAALVLLRVYRALGPPAAWQTALARAKSLAGERRVPPDLEPPP